MLDYFNIEKNLLSTLGKEFAERHPGVAPLLGSGSIDPDVERLLEGLAFLSANLRHKIDDEFPELATGLLRLVAPYFLRPVPAATIMQFSPTIGSVARVVVPAGSEISSVPVEGVRCIFRTCCELTMQPLSITDVAFQRPDLGDPELALTFRYAGGNLGGWEGGPLRIFVNGMPGQAENLFYYLSKKATSIAVRNDEGRDFLLPATALRLPGFDDANALYPYPPQALRSHRILQEYLSFPAKFRILEVAGLERWRERGRTDTFQLVFKFPPDSSLEDVRKARAENFILNAVEAVNLHTGWACPVTLDHRKHEYRIIADFSSAGAFQLFSIDAVTGVSAVGGQQHVYQCAESFGKDTGDPLYTLSQRTNPVSQRAETFLSVLYPPDHAPQPETLSIAATFTVPDLPARLNVGDIRLSTGTSPVAARARNVIPTTRGAMPPQDKGMLWTLISFLSANSLSLANEQCLQKLLETFSYVCGKDEGKRQELLMQVKSLGSVTCTPGDMLRRGQILRGCDVVAETTGNGFESEGTLHIFAMVLDIFFGSTMRLNHFCRFVLKNKSTGTQTVFPPRLGQTLDF